MARLFLAARGVEPTTEALAGALDEVEHRAAMRALVDGIASVGADDEPDPDLEI